MAPNKNTLVFAAAAAAALLLALAPAPAAAKVGPRSGLRSLKNNNNNNNQNNNNNNNNNNNHNQNNQNQLPAPVITCEGATVSSITVSVCPGGPSFNAPFGFTLLFEDLETFIDEGGFPCGNGDAACRATITNAFQGEDDCWTLTIGTETPVEDVTFTPPSCNNELPCGTEFLFRAFALGGQNFNQSAPSATTSCVTSACAPPVPCSNTQGSGANAVTSCGLCRPSCGVVSRAEVCEFYEVAPDARCRISARGGGGQNPACAQTEVCCVVNPPNTVSPDASGVCAAPSPIVGLDTAPITFAAARKP